MNRQQWTFTAVLLGVIVLSAGLTALPARADHVSARADVGLYYDELSPYGDWVDDSQYGSAWCPRHVGSDWRPYSDGRWVDSDYGWTWASDEPFGWATYHYGRWAFDPHYGWIWIPGTVWAPAWVSWQYGGGYVGWAPLPPQVGFDYSVGIRLGGLSLSAVIQPRDYLFVSERGFLEPRVGRYAVPRTRNQDLWRRARNVTDYSVINNRVINRGISVTNIERATRHKVPRFRVAEVNSRGSAGVARDQLRVYRPPSAKLRAINVAVRNDAGVRPGVGRGREQGRARQPEARPDTRITRRPEARPQPRAPERRNQVAPARPESRPKPIAKPSERPNNRPPVQTRPQARPHRPEPADRPNARPPVQTRPQHRPEPQQVEKPRNRPEPPQVNRPRTRPTPEVSRPQPRSDNRPNARPQPRERQQRPEAKPRRPHGGGGGGGNGGQQKPHGQGHGG
ncbi:MAG TPA: DUF6600 domain-containing protein [Thermoanaerobaculia bacterium]|jgi:hypothetical protein|nr:DUF6600 domain-containing protein [Thermoanaerobaculia bacterium]